MGSRNTTIQAPAQQALPSAGQTASEIAQASLQYDPLMAQNAYNIATNPNYGAQPFTQALEDVRSNVFTQESAIRDQLLQNILGSLQSPTGVSQQQQGSIDASRQDARGNLQEALRNRANLGGNLYGGRSAAAEGRDMGNLENMFAQEDISRDERSRLNAIQSALPALSILFPDLQITQPQFQSAVPSANSVYGAQSGAISQQNAFANQAALQNAQNRSGLQQALFGALGNAAGAAMPGMGAAAGWCWVAAEIFGGWYAPKTIACRLWIATEAPKWFRDFYMEHGEKIAEFISDKPLLKLILRPAFELMAYLGKTSFKFV